MMERVPVGSIQSCIGGRSKQYVKAKGLLSRSFRAV